MVREFHNVLETFLLVCVAIGMTAGVIIWIRLEKQDHVLAIALIMIVVLQNYCNCVKYLISFPFLQVTLGHGP